MSEAVTSGLPKVELQQLINVLIDNRYIKDILMKSIWVHSFESRSTTPAATPSIAQRNIVPPVY
jgi:hypothetical protein